MQLRLLGQASSYSLGKIVCVGRNYAEHAAELNNPIPEEPLLFIKPSTSGVPMSAPLDLQQQTETVHYETEIALLIGQPLSRAASGDQAMQAVVGVGLALDLTLRGLQSRLKEKGHPWERAKAWDGACPLSDFVPAEQVRDWSDLHFSLSINDEVRQQGHSGQMLVTIPELVAHISQTFTLLPGDVVITGTPAGVGQLQSGDQLALTLDAGVAVHTRVL